MSGARLTHQFAATARGKRLQTLSEILFLRFFA
jgi:hypothetical protein